MTAKVAAKDMGSEGVDRRAVLGQALACGAALAAARQIALASPSLAQEASPAAPENPFTPGTVKDIARRLAGADFAKSAIELPEPFNKLSYDQYRDIRFKTEQAIWHGDKLDTEVQLFPMGWLYDAPVDIWLVENCAARKLKAANTLYTLGHVVGAGPDDEAPVSFASPELSDSCTASKVKSGTARSVSRIALPPPSCCMTWTNSCARSRFPVAVSGAYCRAPKTTSSTPVNAWAFSACAAACAAAFVWTRTFAKLRPSCSSIKP